jgi:hypothetical protein
MEGVSTTHKTKRPHMPELQVLRVIRSAVLMALEQMFEFEFAGCGETGYSWYVGYSWAHCTSPGS